MLRVALLVSLGLVAVQAQSDASLPSQRAERMYVTAARLTELGK